MRRLSIITILAVAMLSVVSCYPTRIVTVSPSTPVGYSTTVSHPNHTVTTTKVYASDYDLCLHLDLQAVGAAFAQASSVREFEILLNNSSYFISNLDLNRDGYVDYLRVVETLDRYTHVFLVQAVLGRNIYQDVATIVVENPSYANTYVEIIGSPYIYGRQYIVRPVYLTRPNIFAHLCVRGYRPWTSPWHWDYYPSHYKRPAPVYLSHYQAYVETYMHNHRYCHEVMYPAAYHYTNYDVITRHLQRNDYGSQHPEQSFTSRTANTPVGNSAVQRAANARDIRAAQQATQTTTRTAASTATTPAGTNSRTPANTGSTTSRTQSAASSSSTNSRTPANTGTTSNRTQSSASTSTSTTSRTQSSAATSTNGNTGRTQSTGTATSSRREQTTVDTRVNSSGAARTRTSTSEGTSSSRRPSSSTSSSSTATRSSASTSSGSSESTSRRTAGSTSTSSSNSRSGSNGSSTGGRR